MIHGFFFVVNNGEVRSCHEIQQLRCSVCFPHVVPPLIEKKTKGKKCLLHTTSFMGLVL
jgi:hypothetical protein